MCVWRYHRKKSCFLLYLKRFSNLSKVTAESSSTRVIKIKVTFQFALIAFSCILTVLSCVFMNDFYFLFHGELIFNSFFQNAFAFFQVLVS